MKELQSFAYKNFNYVVKTEKDSSILKSIKIKPYVLSNYELSEYDYNNIEKVLDSYIILPENITKSFYSSFNEVVEKNRFELFVDQLKHYNSTYGAENFNEKVIPYIPNTNIDIPDILLKNIKYITVKSLETFKNDFINYIYATTAVNSNSISNIFEIIQSLNIQINFNKIKSKELKAKAFSKNMYTPNNSEEFLKGVVAYLINSSLYIKNKKTLEDIKNNIVIEEKYDFVFKKFNNYTKMHGYISLAEIFNRNKQVFIALKHKELKTIINRIAKYSKKYHKPKIIPDYMKIVSTVYSKRELHSILNSLETMYLVRIYNTINFRLSLMFNNLNGYYYHNRNNTGWFSKKRLYINNISYLEFLKIRIKDIIKERIIRNIQKYDIDIDQIFLSDINYAVPESEKRFIGNIPYGSEFNIDTESFAIGIYWENKNTNRIDLDLSMTSIEHKYGWDSNYHSYGINSNDDFEIIFSGDMTDAKNGAFEVFSIQNKNKIEKTSMYFFNLNYYNYDTKLMPLDYKFLISKNSDISENTEIKSIFNNIIFQTHNQLNHISEILGYLKIDKENTNYSRFVFNNFSLSNSISAKIPEIDIIKIIDLYSNKLKFKDLFKISKPKKITDKNLNKDILIKLVK